MNVYLSVIWIYELNFTHFSVYHEDVNAPHRRHREEPKSRPLRVGDTEKPAPESSKCKASHSHLKAFHLGLVVMLHSKWL